MLNVVKFQNFLWPINFEVLRHLTKVKDEFLQRKNILNNLDKLNYFDDNNYQFETGINFELDNNSNIKKIERKKFQ